MFWSERICLVVEVSSTRATLTAEAPWLMAEYGEGNGSLMNGFTSTCEASAWTIMLPLSRKLI
jgi:hypothetical protein